MTLAALLPYVPQLAETLAPAIQTGLSAGSTPDLNVSRTGQTTINVGGIDTTPDGQVLSIGTGGDDIGSKIMLSVIVALIAGSVVAVIKS